MKTARYLAAALAAAGVAMLVAGPLWAVIDSDIGRTDENFGLGDGTVHGEWLPGQVFLMIAGAVFCLAAVAAAFVRGGAELMSRRKVPDAGLKRILALGAAAGVALVSALAAVPASAVPASSIPPPAATEEPTAAGAGVRGPGLSGFGLSEGGFAEAVLNDLGLTPEEFAAAGELGKQAADASAGLRDVPGYIGTRLQGGRILVTGSGPELEARVGELSSTVPAVELEAPPADAETGAEAAESLVPSVPASGKELARSTQQLYQAYLREVGPAGLQAVAYSGGRFVIRAGGVNAPEATPPDSTGSNATTSNGTVTDATTSDATPSDAAGRISAAEFVARYANVVLDDGAELAPEADVVGGQGYFADTGEICSTGFSAFDPAGLPSVLTAGHCSSDGAAQQATLEFPQWNPAGLLGTFGFSQFGGPGNSAIGPGNTGNPPDPANPGNVGTDVAVIGSIRAGLDPEPAASTWNDPSLAGPDVKIIGAAAPVVGQPVCRSGRSSAWSCGTIDEVGIYVVQGRSADPADLRAFTGFLSFAVQSSGGDSGGPWLSGNYAVGIHSAGDVPDANGNVIRNFAIAATLDDALAVLPGYQLELFLNKPELVAPANLTLPAGTNITGRVPAAPASAVAANSKVRITVAGHQPLEVPVDAGGNWSFKAPEAPGTFAFSAETVNGFSRSGGVSLSALVTPSSLSAPTITTPASNPLPELKSLSGTGTPGATVTLSGDVAGSGTVGADGQWSVPLTGPAAFGKVKVTAVVSYADLADSQPATGTFTVTPPAPAVSSISDGQHLRQDALPSTISGSGVNGAEVTVSIDGVPLDGAPVGGGVGSRSVASTFAPLVLVAGGGWSVPFPAELALGTHTVSVTQAVEGVTSAPAAITFAIDAPPLAVVVPAQAPPAAVPAANGALAPAGDLTAVGPPAAYLANTGVSGIMTAAGVAAGAIAVGGLLMVMVRRRKRRAPKQET